MTDIEDYVGIIGKNKPVPKSEFELAHNMLESFQAENPFSDIVDLNIQVTNIKDPKLMRSYQRSMVILTELKSIALKDPECFAGTYRMIYNSVRNELLMSKADGNERKLLGSLGNVRFNSSARLGEGLRPDPDLYYEEEEEPKGNFLSNLFKKKR